MTEEEKNALRNVFERMLEEERGYGQVTTLSIDHEIAKENLSYVATHRKDWTITIGFTEENYGTR